MGLPPPPPDTDRDDPLARRADVQRLTEARRIGDVEGAAAHLAELGVLLAAGGGPLASVASAVAGETVSGSWWSHPRAHTIFSVLRELRTRPDTLTCRLLEGKVTFIHERLRGAFLRAALDEDYRRHAESRLSEEGEAMLALARGRGEVRTDDPEARACARGREETSRLLLTAEREVHTGQGKHVVFLAPIEESLPARVLRQGKRIPLGRARGELLDAALDGAVAVPLAGADETPWKALAGWFPWEDGWIEEAVADRLADGRLTVGIAGSPSLIWRERPS